MVVLVVIVVVVVVVVVVRVVVVVVAVLVHGSQGGRCGSWPLSSLRCEQIVGTRPFRR